MTALTAIILGVPSEGVAEKDDLVAVYGAPAEQTWTRVARFFAKFYWTEPEARLLEVANQLILTMSAEGIAAPSGGRIANVSGKALFAAMNETVQRPPNNRAAAIVFVLKKLEQGRANLELGKDGLTPTERRSAEQKREERTIAPEVRRLMDAGTGMFARRAVTTKTDEQRTALRWLRSNVAVRQELAESCERQFATWRQDLPNLDTIKDNWLKAEALKRWRALGRPIPLPPR
jgi:hypothetical protein